MTIENGLCTLADFLLFLPNSGNVNTALAENAIEAASREITNQAGRSFLPYIKTNLYNTPTKNELCLKDDLLEMLTLTNGSGDEILSTQYRMWPYNLWPKATIVLRNSSSLYWETSTTEYDQAAISSLGIWAYHDDYDRAWKTGSTLNGAITTTTATSVPVTSGTLFAAGQIIRVDNELMLVTAAVTNTLTVTRGWNGSTAATHLTLATVTIWHAQPDIVRGCLIQTSRLYRRNEAVFGTTGGGEMGVQPVTLPMLDPDVQRIVDMYKLRF